MLSIFCKLIQVQQRVRLHETAPAGVLCCTRSCTGRGVMLHSRRGVKLPMRKYLLQGSLICRGKLPMPMQGSLICRGVTAGVHKSNPCPLGNWLTARQHSTLSTCIFGSESKIEKSSSTLSTCIFGSESRMEKSSRLRSRVSKYLFSRTKYECTHI